MPVSSVLSFRASQSTREEGRSVAASDLESEQKRKLRISVHSEQIFT